MGKYYPKYLEIGTKFERLSVLQEYETSKSKNGIKVIPSQWKYICQCNCGGIRIVPRVKLIHGRIKMCKVCAEKLRVEKVSKTNPVEYGEDYIKLFFYNVNGYTIIDKEDYDKVKCYCWSLTSRGYVEARDVQTSKNVLLHRLLLLPSNNNNVIDHIDGNPLNNRRNNLRVCTQSQNAKNSKLPHTNTSGHKGIIQDTRYGMHGKWWAYIKYKGKVINLGRYSTMEDAIMVREKKEIELFGEYSSLVCRKENLK